MQVAVHGEWGTAHKGVHAVASVAHHSNHAFCLGRELIFGSGGIGLGRDDGGGRAGCTVQHVHKPDQVGLGGVRQREEARSC